MRVFIAVEVPEEYKGKIRKIQEEFSKLGNINLVKDYHCTLKFLGEITEKQAGEVREKLRKIKMKRFEARMQELGVFPNMNYINVIWIGLKGRVNELQSKIDSELQEMFPKDNRFSAHVTLGRVKSVKDKKAIREKLGMDIKEMKFEVKEFKIIKSTLTQEGPEYETLETYSLE